MIPILLAAGALLASGAYTYYSLDYLSKEMERYDYLKQRDSQRPVELVSSNYKGKKKYKRELGVVETEWYNSLSRAKYEIKEQARKRGGDMIFNVHIYRDTDTEPGPRGGTHKFAVWKASGIAVKK